MESDTTAENHASTEEVAVLASTQSLVDQSRDDHDIVIDQSNVAVMDSNVNQSNLETSAMYKSDIIEVDQSNVTVVDSNSDPSNVGSVAHVAMNQSDVIVIDSNIDQSNVEYVMHQSDTIDVDQSDVIVVDSNSDQSNVGSVHQSEDCILMEYRKKGDGRAGVHSSDSSSTSTSSGDESSDEEHDATDTKINKAISRGRDESPEGNRHIKMNRHGFEDIRTKGELLPEELPPLEELCITVDESVEMVAVGTIKSVIGVLVVIQSNANIPALNDETILFVEGHKVLGQVFEIFGPVTTPWYSVRFNEEQNITAKDLKVGMEVYCAPREESFTKYVFMDGLRQVRGSDASWEDNNEPPEKYLDYSDDESERHAKSKKKNKRRRNREPEAGSQDTGNQNRSERDNNSARQRHPRDECNGERPELPARANRNPFHGPDARGNRPRFPGGPPDRFCEPNNWNGRGNFGPPDRGGWGDNGRQNTFYGRPPTNFGGPPQFNAPNFNNNNNNRNQRPLRPPPEAFHNFGNSNFDGMPQFNSCDPRMQGNPVRSFNPPVQGQNNQPPPCRPPPGNQFNRPPPPMFSQPPPSFPNAPPTRQQAPPAMAQGPPPRQHAPPPRRQAPTRPQAPPPRQQDPPPGQQAPLLGQQAPPHRQHAPPTMPQAPPSTMHSGSGQMIRPLMGENINRLTPPPGVNGQNANTNSNDPCPNCNAPPPQNGQLNPPRTTSSHQNPQRAPGQPAANNDQPFGIVNTPPQPRPGFIGGPPANQPPPLMSQSIGQFHNQSSNVGTNQSHSGQIPHKPPQAVSSGSNKIPPWVQNKPSQQQEPMSGNCNSINSWEQPQMTPQNINYHNCVNDQNNGMNTFTQPSSQNSNSGPNFQNPPPWRANSAVQNNTINVPGQPRTYDANQFTQNTMADVNQNKSMPIVDRRFIQNNE